MCIYVRTLLLIFHYGMRTAHIPDITLLIFMILFSLIVDILILYFYWMGVTYVYELRKK